VAHMHYKGTGQMHSFRGLLVDGGQQRIRIQGATGEIAWRITSFQVMAPSAAENIESVVKIYREEQDTPDLTINFNNNELLGAAVISQSATMQNYPDDTSVIFDRDLFVRNIYVTLKGADYTADVNYYIELEEVKVSAAGMAQLAVAAARRTA